jgi:hypothetical protein
VVHQIGADREEVQQAERRAVLALLGAEEGPDPCLIQ